MAAVAYGRRRQTDLGGWRMADGGLEVIAHKPCTDAQSAGGNDAGARSTAAVWLSQNAVVCRLDVGCHQ